MSPVLRPENFRDQLIAASLKHRFPESTTSFLLDFRDQLIAASLKQGASNDVIGAMLVISAIN